MPDTYCQTCFLKVAIDGVHCAGCKPSKEALRNTVAEDSYATPGVFEKHPAWTGPTMTVIDEAPGTDAAVFEACSTWTNKALFAGPPPAHKFWPSKKITITAPSIRDTIRAAVNGVMVAHGRECKTPETRCGALLNQIVAAVYEVTCKPLGVHAVPPLMSLDAATGTVTNVDEYERGVAAGIGLAAERVYESHTAVKVLRLTDAVRAALAEDLRVFAAYHGPNIVPGKKEPLACICPPGTPKSLYGNCTHGWEAYYPDGVTSLGVGDVVRLNGSTTDRKITHTYGRDTEGYCHYETRAADGYVMILGDRQIAFVKRSLPTDWSAFFTQFRAEREYRDTNPPLVAKQIRGYAACSEEQAELLGHLHRTDAVVTAQNRRDTDTLTRELDEKVFGGKVQMYRNEEPPADIVIQTKPLFPAGTSWPVTLTAKKIKGAVTMTEEGSAFTTGTLDAIHRAELAETATITLKYDVAAFVGVDSGNGEDRTGITFTPFPITLPTGVPSYPLPESLPRVTNDGQDGAPPPPRNYAALHWPDGMPAHLIVPGDPVLAACSRCKTGEVTVVLFEGTGPAGYCAPCKQKCYEAGRAIVAARDEDASPPHTGLFSRDDTPAG